MGGMETRHALVALVVAVGFVVPSGAARAAYGTGDRPGRSGATVLPDAEARIVKLINRKRAAAGLVRLRVDAAARSVADHWSRQMAVAGGIGHNGEYFSPNSLERFHASLVGENVAVGASVNQIHQLFMESGPHRANVLHPDYRPGGRRRRPPPPGAHLSPQSFLDPPGPAQANFSPPDGLTHPSEPHAHRR